MDEICIKCGEPTIRARLCLVCKGEIQADDMSPDEYIANKEAENRFNTLRAVASYPVLKKLFAPAIKEAGERQANGMNEGLDSVLLEAGELFDC